MTTQQFLEVFQRHLTVGGPKREEIIREVTSHLQEQSADKLGDPVALAKKLNRVHVGFLSSLRSLAVVATATTVLFDVILPYVGIVYQYDRISVPWLFQMSWLIIPFISPVVFIYGTHMISRMKNRWASVAIVAAIFAAGFMIHQELMQATGYLLIVSANGSQSVWAIHIQPVVSFFITYAALGYGVMVGTAGRQLIVARHHIIDLILAFILESVAAYFLLPMIWNAITSFHYTEAMYEWSVPVFEHLMLVSIGVGLLGAAIEWYRVRAVTKIIPRA